MRFGTRLAVAAISSLMLCASASAQMAARAEHELFAEVNQARRTYGLPALRWDESLAAAARQHAAVMAQHGEAEHVFAGEATVSARVKQAGARFSWLAENVAQGPAASFIHAEFMKSPNHRANVLDGDMDSIGVGVVTRGQQLFVVEDFSKAR